MGKGENHSRPANMKQLHIFHYTCIKKLTNVFMFWKGDLDLYSPAVCNSILCVVLKNSLDLQVR